MMLLQGEYELDEQEDRLEKYTKKEIQKIDDSWFTTIYKNGFWVSPPKVSKFYVKHFIIAISISKFVPTCCVAVVE